MPYCVECGTKADGEANYCPECGSKIKQKPVETAEPASIDSTVPCVKNIKCPSCEENDLTILGFRLAVETRLGTTWTLGSVVNFVSAAMVAGDTTTARPILYKCNGCNNKFESFPLAAAPGDVLESPCVVVFERVSGFAGAAVPQIVYNNGVKIGPVKNAQKITFQTLNKSNTIFVADDHHGVAFKDKYTFEARPNEIIKVRFKGKFL